MTVTSAYETIAPAIVTIINTEFAAEGFTAIHDNLHESLGRERVDIGVAPVEDMVPDRNGVVIETWVQVRFYNVWPREIDPNTAVDPRIITNYAERFRRAMQASSLKDPQTEVSWFFDVRRIEYPNDPTGNKTRFVATVRGWGNNSGLVETTG